MALHGEVAQAIARQIQVTLTPQEKTQLTRTRTVNPEAYEAYLKGRSYFYKLTPGDLDIAQQYFEIALEKDPDYSLAHVGIAMVWVGRRQTGFLPSLDSIPPLRGARGVYFLHVRFTTTSPCSVNLTALLSKLSRICRKRVKSPTMAVGTCPSIR